MARHVHAVPSCITWRKSSRSNGAGGECVELATTDHGVAVRDSKHPTGPTLSFRPDEWATFLHNIKTGQHDLS
ncbi:hypothetical protein Acsp04_32540 [Actinomadura sp. NBRC 104425]|uniref:DUF397 domain-containing protein n=1 Tax=Actinomadura sp. NBRC 104425 TaxID=3032204 RepID=UPI0024A0DC7F|nr:DUF397 domain-containing protein [Actinomadura sp. NBRC 104425]GLZ13019.1 hypothetical protein Acsp04_32540 [Actinomadura sp. NBRC 104425]